jgi:hypothetical protein
MKSCKSALAVMGATVVLGSLVASATARSFNLSSQTIRATFTEVIFEGPFGVTNCQVTLEGSLHSRTVVKSVGTLMGYITRAALGPCSVGTATILALTLPWHVRYAGFTGTLPAISTLVTNMIGASFRIRETFGVFCLARSTTTEPAIGTYRVEGSGISGAVIGGSIRVGAECFGVRGRLTSVEGIVTVLGTSATRVTISLI